MKRKIVVEPFGYDFLRATMYRKTWLGWKIEQRTHMANAYVNELNQTVEYWRQAKQIKKSEIVHKGMGKKDNILDEVVLYWRGWWFKLLLKKQIERANEICRLTGKMVYVLTNSKGYPRALTNHEIRIMKKRKFIRKDVTALDLDKECLYSVTKDKLNNKK
jgi:hypothetical protein